MIYNLFLFLYKSGINTASLWNPKARLWVKGRKNVQQEILAASRHSGKKNVWIHCSSLGEFEQGRPVIDAIRQMHPDAFITLTFFSPSGYEIRKNYAGADFICYLPMDSRRNARLFLDAIRPVLVCWIKYDYWHYYLSEIKQRNIPLLLISGIFWKEQLFFKWYGSFYRSILRCFTHLFVQTPQSKKLLESIGFSSNVSINGDTRFDRVIEIAEKAEPIDLITAFCGSNPVIVAGSTWEADEEELDHFANTHPEIRFIIAPHEITAAHLGEIMKLFRNAVFYSDYEKIVNDASPEKNDLSRIPANVLIIDNIGMLSRLYQYATITYVGGGFGNDGIHNVLEPAVYGKPVIFGPAYEKFIEAVELVDAGGAFSVANAVELEQVLTRLLENPAELARACTASGDYVKSRKGAKDRIMRYINEKNFLTFN